MTEKWTDLSEFLDRYEVEGSTPTRLDCGGSTDHRLTGLLCSNWRPATANIAIDLRARVTLGAHRPGRILIAIDGLGEREFTAPDLTLNGPFALVSALVCYFGIQGLRISVRTEFPFQSGLGGSGSVAVALIGAIHAALYRKVPAPRQFPGLARIAHNIEDSLFGNTGMQDQAAALYGGANLWEWRYADRLDFKRRKLVSDMSTLDGHLLLAYTGRPHLQSRDGSQMLERFKETAALGLFVSISDHARRFAEFLKAREFGSAGESLAAEYRLRSSFLPAVFPDDLELIEMAEAARCGVRVTGRGGGGCVWAIGEKPNIDELRTLWSGAFERRKVGSLLPAKATRSGLTVEIRQKGESETGK